MRKSYSITGVIGLFVLFALLAGIHSVRPTFLSDAFNLVMAILLYLLGVAIKFGAWAGSFFSA